MIFRSQLLIFRTAFGTNLDILLNNINNHLHTVYEWLCNNKLTLNLSKTKYIFFIPRQKKNQNRYPPLKIATFVSRAILIYQVPRCTNYLSSKISENLNILTKLRPHLTINTLRCICYSTLFHSLVSGGGQFWKGNWIWFVYPLSKWKPTNWQ